MSLTVLLSSNRYSTLPLPTPDFGGDFWVLEEVLLPVLLTNRYALPVCKARVQHKNKRVISSAFLPGSVPVSQSSLAIFVSMAFDVKSWCSGCDDRMTKHISRSTCGKHLQGLRQRLDSFALFRHTPSVYKFGLDLREHCPWVVLSSLCYK